LQKSPSTPAIKHQTDGHSPGHITSDLKQRPSTALHSNRKSMVKPAPKVRMSSQFDEEDELESEEEESEESSRVKVFKKI
jgi:hypothetical protein